MTKGEMIDWMNKMLAQLEATSCPDDTEIELRCDLQDCRFAYESPLSVELDSCGRFVKMSKKIVLAQKS